MKFVKIGVSVKFHGFLVEFYKEQVLLRKAKIPRKLPEKCTFLQIFAENRRKPQIFAENRRKPQIFAETGLSHLVCPF